MVKIKEISYSQPLKDIALIELDRGYTITAQESELLGIGGSGYGLNKIPSHGINMVSTPKAELRNIKNISHNTAVKTGGFKYPALVDPNN